MTLGVVTSTLATRSKRLLTGHDCHIPDPISDGIGLVDSLGSEHQIESHTTYTKLEGMKFRNEDCVATSRSCPKLQNTSLHPNMILFRRHNCSDTIHTFVAEISLY